MKTITTPDGVEIAYKRTGSGPPMVLVHGSWTSHHGWDDVVEALADSFCVVVYDRRGHSESQRLAGQGSINEDVADLAILIEALGLAPAWVVGNSFGASISLRLAAMHGELMRGVIVHEPPLWELICDDPDLIDLVEKDEELTVKVADLIASGDCEGGARFFIEYELGPGSWSQLPPGFRATFVENAPTFLDEARDPDQFGFDSAWLIGFEKPAMLTVGGEGSPAYAGVVLRLTEVLPQAEVVRFEGAGHVPHMTHPEEYVEATRSFVARHE